MSVRRRLFLSNMLMLILPIITMVVTSICVLLIYTGMNGGRDANAMNNWLFLLDRMDDVENMALKWEDGMSLDGIKQEIESFNQQNSKEGVILSLYSDKKKIYPIDDKDTSVAINGSIEQKHLVITDTAAEYRVPSGNDMIHLTFSNITLNRESYKQPILVGVIMFLILVTVVLLTNWFLTKFVFNSIMNPIQTLVYGVNQLRDGNLAYRIQYRKRDEFKEVCMKFNEMAHRLSTMVDQRQKDESNRRELIAGISHDLRTPLTSIKAYLEGIEKGVASTPEMQKKYFNIIKSKTANLEQIINQLFLFSKLDTGEFPLYLETVKLKAEIDRMMAIFMAEYAPQGLDIRVRNQIEEAEVVVDVVQFRNVIQNVLENSLKYKNKENAMMYMECTEEAHFVEFILGDDGPGVPDKELERLFDVFYRGDTSRKKPDLGSGLGLAIASKIIERFDGSIRADRATSGGLAIIIRLPKQKGGRGERFEERSDH